MSAPSNPPAFPIPNATDLDGYVYAPEAEGMTLRDYFAGMALAGLMAHHETSPGELGYGKTLCKNVADAAYDVADAMLAEREKQP